MSFITQEFILNDKIDNQSKVSVESARRELFEVDPRSLMISDETEEDLRLVKDVSGKIQSSFKNIIIIGTGASESIPRTLFDLGESQLNIVFLSNVDQHCVDRSLKNLDKKDTCVLSISKSGKTVETVALTEYVIDWIQGEPSITSVDSRFFFITELKESPLLKIAEDMGATIIRHSAIGGRFALFTSLGFLSASLAGFDIDKIISGVHEVFPRLIEPGSWVMEAASYNLSMNRKFSNNVFINYGDSFEGINLWCRQLVAESLGKGSKGINHISSRGAVDHHSQLQLYLDGPDDKFFTIFFLEQEKNQESKFKFSEILERQRMVAIRALQKKKKNIRVISAKNINEGFIAEFVMGIMLEVILFAYVQNIDPFSQPAVEEMKKEFIF